MKRSSALLEANIVGFYPAHCRRPFSTSLGEFLAPTPWMACLSKRDYSSWPVCSEAVKTCRTEGSRTLPSRVCASDLWNPLLALHRLRWVWKVLSTAISERITRFCVSNVRCLFTHKSGVHPALSLAFIARADMITHRVPVYPAAITAPVRLHPARRVKISITFLDAWETCMESKSKAGSQLYAWIVSRSGGMMLQIKP
jgi:hypothetical protein